MLRTKALLFETKAAEDGTKVYRFRATSGVVDRQDEIVTPDGWQTDTFMRNPVFLVAHDYSSLPVGKVIAITNDGAGLVAEVVFDMEDPRAADVARKYDKGFLNAVSVGFKSIEQAGTRYGKEPLQHTKKELLEISAVAVPANPEALMLRSLTTEDALHALSDRIIEHLQTKGIESPLPIKSADFNQVYQEARDKEALYHLRWQIEDALYTVIHKTLEDEELDNAGKMALFSTSLDQHKSAMLGWFAQFMALVADKSLAIADAKGLIAAVQKAGRTLSKKNESLLRQAHECMSTVLASVEDMPMDDDEDHPMDGKSQDPPETPIPHEEPPTFDSTVLSVLAAFAGKAN